MFRARKTVIFLFFLSFLMLFSCNKEEEDRTRELLRQYDWEQLGQLPWDASYNEHKFFHTLRFNTDYNYFMETNWSFYDTLIYTEAGRYEYEEGNQKIIFPDAIDTIDDGSLFLRIYFSPWYILQVDDTLLVVRAESGYQPQDDPGGMVRFEGDTLYFRPKR